MGCDIHSHAEVLEDGKWEKAVDCFELDDYGKKRTKKKNGSRPFEWRSYRLFGFLAGVRNYSHVPTIAKPKGFPKDASEAVKADYDLWDMDAHTSSWLTLSELLSVNYDETFWDRRITRTVGNVTNGAALAMEGEGETLTLREFLGDWYFNRLDELKALGEPEKVRIVFWFDN